MKGKSASIETGKGSSLATGEGTSHSIQAKVWTLKSDKVCAFHGKGKGAPQASLPRGKGQGASLEKGKVALHERKRFILKKWTGVFFAWKEGKGREHRLKKESCIP